MARQYGILHISFLLAFGLLGWVTLITLTVWPVSAFPRVAMTWEHGLVLLLLAPARFLSFRIYRRERIALDSAFYVATAFAFGVLDSAWLLLLTLTLDAVVNFLWGKRSMAEREAPLRYTLSYILYQGGLPSVVMLACQAFFHFTVGPIQVDGPGVDDVHLAWTLSAFSLLFVAGHYALAGGAPFFHGAHTVWRKFFFPVVGAELILTPLALAMAMGYKHQGIPLFLLIGFTGLIFGGIFRSWATTSDQERRRMVELSVVNQLSRAMAKSIDQDHLFQNIAQATLQLVGRSSFFTIGVVDSAKAEVDYEMFDGDAQSVERLVARMHDGVSGWVVQHAQPLVVSDLQRDYGRYARDDRYRDQRFHSWIGVPVQSYGRVVAVISLQSEERGAFDADQLRVMTIIADQVAVAVEASRLYELSTIDSLTGLFVRRYFDQRLEEEFHRSVRYDTPLSVGLLDLDYFKRINDTYGHPFGDKVLRCAAQAMRGNMRSFDIAARYGGEEFVFVLPRTGAEDALAVAERIRADVAALRLSDEAGELVSATASVGIATLSQGQFDSPQALLKAVDMALYRAKDKGRNLVVAAK